MPVITNPYRFGDGGGGVTYLVNENFETLITGYDSGLTWTPANSPNPAYTTTVLLGTQSLFCPATATTYASFTGVTTIEAYCLFRISALPGSVQSCLAFRDSSGNAAGIFRINATGNISIFANASDSTFTTDAMSAVTTYHVWIRVVSGGTCSVEFSTDGVRVGSGNKYTSKTGATITPGRIQANGPAGVSAIYDRILVKDATSTPISSNP
jgi:hypothetical protein